MIIGLPAPLLKGHMSLEAAIAARRSVRRFQSGPLTMAQVSQLLWCIQGMTHEHRRAVPSAGATYPLELVLVAGAGCVEDLPAGTYRYATEGHSLMPGRPGDSREELAVGALGQNCVAAAPVTIAICAVLARTAARYGRRAERYVNMEAGHAGQNIHLQAVALGLGAVMVGAFDDDAVARTLGLEEDTRPLYLVPVGRPP